MTVKQNLMVLWFIDGDLEGTRFRNKRRVNCAWQTCSVTKMREKSGSIKLTDKCFRKVKYLGTRVKK